MADLPVFRASKRRKTALKSTDPNPNKSGSESGDDQYSSSLVKPRSQMKSKPKSGGISFSNSRLADFEAHRRRDDESMAVVPVSGEGSSENKMNGLSNRFVMSGSGSGRGGDAVRDDENIMAYIDAEMARRHQQKQIEAPAQRPANPRTQVVMSQNDGHDNHGSDEDNDAISTHSTNSNDHDQPQSKPSDIKSPSNPPRPLGPSQHRLTEIDLSTQPPQQPTQKSNLPRKKKPKVRLGRDGKPFRPRPRKQRDEEDVAREALVEQVLHDNGFGMGMYTSNAQAGGGGNANRGDDEDADERMEREFMREFLERQQGGQGAGKSGGGGDAKKEGGQGAAGLLASGPRLGGSRSARARMVAALEKERDGAKGS